MNCKGKNSSILCCNLPRMHLSYTMSHCGYVVSLFMTNFYRLNARGKWSCICIRPDARSEFSRANVICKYCVRLNGIFKSSTLNDACILSILVWLLVMSSFYQNNYPLYRLLDASKWRRIYLLEKYSINFEIVIFDFFLSSVYYI